MELGIVQKMKIIFDLLFSSFMSIELILLFFLLFLLLLVNIKVKNKIIPFIFTFLVVIMLILFTLSFPSYVITCLDSFIMKVMDYYYFPSTVAYFFILVFMALLFIITMFSKKIKPIKKIFNYLCSTLFFLFFSLFTSLVFINHIDIQDPVHLYENQNILTVVQLSNFILLFWILYTLFYSLYLFFKKKFDKSEKVEEN